MKVLINKIVAAALIMLLMALSACTVSIGPNAPSGTDKPTDAPTSPEITEAPDHTGQLGWKDVDTMEVGEEATLTLSQNPSTGFLWYYEIAGDGIVEVVSDEYRSDPEPEGWTEGYTGLGGKRYITVKALSPGEAAIDLVCKRRDDEVDQAFTVRILVPGGQETATAQPFESAVLWLDEKDPADTNAVFRIGMSIAEVEAAIKAHGLEVKNVWSGEGYRHYDAGPFSLFSNELGGLYIIQLGFYDDDGIRSGLGFDGTSTPADAEAALGRPLAACAQDDSIIYLYEKNGCYAEIYMNIEKPCNIERISLAAGLDYCIVSPEYDEYDEIHDYVTGKTESVSASRPERAQAEGVVQKGAFYHDGRGEWLDYYYMDAGAKQYAEIAGPGSTPGGGSTEVQLYSNTIDMEQYVGKRIVFNVGMVFAAETVYHRRDFVLEVMEVVRVVE